MPFLLVQRPFGDGDIEGADVVIMATNDSEVNSHIAAICKDKRVLVNVVDVKKTAVLFSGNYKSRMMS